MSREAPRWSPPALVASCLLAGLLVFWDLTINTTANAYYAEAALAASRSWTALATNAADLSGAVSLDKGPLSDLLMGLSGRLFGFSSLSMLAPSGLCGIGAVAVLHDLVRRTLGHRAAALAAVLLALSPVSVAMARYNNPDALLALLLVAAAWALVRSLESGRVRHIALCGGLVGLAFNTKMLEGYLIVPGLAAVFLGAAPGTVGRRLARLTAGAAAMVGVSAAWYGTMMLIPPADRPYVGDTHGNSWFELIFGANGLSRVSGSSGGRGPGGFGGVPGPLRLFNAELAAQIAWLLPLALLGLLAGLWLGRRDGRTDRGRAVLVLLGLWALAGYAVFSFQEGIFHPYYASAIAPALAGLAAVAIVSLAERVRASWAAAALLGGGLAGTAVLAFAILGNAPGFVPWLRWVVLGAGPLAAAAVLLIRVGGWLPGRALLGAGVGLALGGGLVGVLAGPAAYSIATLGHGQTGSAPSAGPALGGFGFRLRPGGRGGGPLGGTFGGPGGGGPRNTADPALVSYLERNRGGARFLVAATGSQSAAPIGLASGAPVITLGGFMGSDPAPSVADLRALVRSGQLHYILLGGRGGFGRGERPVGPSVLFGSAPLNFFGAPPGLLGGGRPGGPGASVSAARTAWVQLHCTTVTVAGSGAGPGLPAGDLYRCTAGQV